MDKKKSRYKNKDGKKLIEVHVKSTLQLFDARDPAPFRERDLDDDFSEYIFSAAREFSISTPLKIVISIEDRETSDLSSAAVKEAIHDFFLYRIDLAASDLKTFFRRGQLYWVIGTLILILSLIISKKIESNTGLFGIVREGAIIFGWVSLWKPTELLMFDWFPIWDKLRLLKKLQMTEIDVHFKVSP